MRAWAMNNTKSNVKGKCPVCGSIKTRMMLEAPDGSQQWWACENGHRWTERVFYKYVCKECGTITYVPRDWRYVPVLTSLTCPMCLKDMPLVKPEMLYERRA
jgi:hypothetical protein